MADIFSHGKILNIAHRGFEEQAPENTLASFLLAMKAGADGVELDVQPTKDGELVVLHDPTLERTTNGSGKVFGKTVQELKQLDAGSWFNRQFSGERIPTLDEVYTALPQHAIVAVELKPLRVTATVPRKVIEVVRRHRAEDRTLLLSYNPVALWHCKRLAPQIPVQLSHQADWREWVIQFFRLLVRLRPDVRSFDLHTICNNPELVAKHQAQGIRIFSGVFARDFEEKQKEALRFLINRGVNGIMTSNPALLRQIVRE